MSVLADRSQWQLFLFAPLSLLRERRAAVLVVIHHHAIEAEHAFHLVDPPFVVDCKGTAADCASVASRAFGLAPQLEEA